MAKNRDSTKPINFKIFLCKYSQKNGIKKNKITKCNHNHKIGHIKNMTIKIITIEKNRSIKYKIVIRRSIYAE